MQNLTLNALQAEILAANRLPTLRLCGKVLLPTGCQIARQEDGAYLLKGYADDGSDLFASLDSAAWTAAAPKPDVTQGLTIRPTWLYIGELLCKTCMEKLATEPDFWAEECYPLTPEETVEFTTARNTCSGCDQPLISRPSPR